MQSRWRRRLGLRGEGAAGHPVLDLEDGSWPLTETEIDEIALRACDVAGVARAALVAAGRARVQSLTLYVEHWVSPVRGTAPRAPRLPGLHEFSVRIGPPAAPGGCQVQVLLAEPSDLGRLLLGLVAALGPRATRSGAHGPDVALACPAPPTASALASRIDTLVLAGEGHDDAVRCTDLVVRGPDDTDSPAAAAVLVAEPDRFRTGDGTCVATVLVDPFVHRPVGRTGASVGSATRLTVDGEHGIIQTLAPQPQDVVRVPLAHGLRAREVGAVAGVGSVDALGVGADPAVLRLLVQLSACGVVVRSHARGGPDVEQSGLPALWSQAPPPGGDLFAATVASVAQRRAALRGLGAGAVVARAWAHETGSPAELEVSALLVTMRPDRLDHALAQLASSRYPRLQVVLGLHGDRFDRDAVDLAVATHLPGRDVVVVEVPASEPFGSALGRASARADGALVTKVDDDDGYGPEHIGDLVLAREYSGAAVVGKPPEYVYLEPLDVTVRRPRYAIEQYGNFVAGGTMLLAKSDLESVGGWRPVPRSVDRALLDRVLRDGGLVYATHGLGFVYVRHGDGHTWDPGTAHFLHGTEQQWPGRLAHPEFGAPTRAGAP